MNEDEDLGIRSEVAFTERISFLRSSLLEILDLGIIDYGFPILLILIIGGRLFSSVSGFWLSLLLFLALLIAVGFWGYFNKSIFINWMSWLFLGKPVFGKLGGIPRSIFFASLKAAQAIEVELHPEDARHIESYQKQMIELQKDELKLAYKEKVYDPRYGDGGGPDFESKWTSVWEDQILELHTGNLKFRDVLENKRLALAFVQGALLQMTPRMHRLFILLEVAILYLAALLLQGRIDMLFLIQMGVFLSFVFALVWYLACTLSGEFITYFDPDLISEKLRSKYIGRFSSLSKTVFRPTELRLKPRFYEVMRGFQIRVILAGISSIITALVLVGVSLLIGRLLGIGDIDEWYAGLALASVAVPFFLLVGFYFISVILQYSRRVIAPIVAGLVGAALPYAINYLFTGEFQLENLENAVSSVIAGLGILLTTVVTTHIQARLEGGS